MTVIPSIAAARAQPYRFFFPSTILVLISDLIPLAGVLWWGWDAFVLLMLYWMETAVIAFWALVRISAVAGGEGEGLMARLSSHIGLTAFFLVHASGFMGVHLLILWIVFAGKWRLTIYNPHDFIQQMVMPFHLWVPLLMSFVGRGFAFVRYMWARHIQMSAALSPKQNQQNAIGEIVGGLYGRIMLMHVTILAGAWIAEKVGSIGPFVLLIVIKTTFDVLAHVLIDLGQVNTGNKQTA